eukprot:m.157022 g.157022  ORF g.157022 m.157022 type:complete len:64 (+) comp16304_c0_seq4:1092-1283(+)
MMSFTTTNLTIQMFKESLMASQVNSMVSSKTQRCRGLDRLHSLATITKSSPSGRTSAHLSELR